MAHTCDDCNTTFQTLSRYRLHDCDPDQKKEADRIAFDQFSQHQDGAPVVCFTVNLEEGTDTYGKFDLAFAVISNEDGEEKFAFIDSNNTPIAEFDYTEEVKTFLDRCLEHEEYITAIQYTNTEYVDEWGNENQLLTGRALGRIFDTTERDPLPPSMLEDIRGIQATLEKTSRNTDEDVTLQQYSDSEYRPPAVETTPGETVLELSLITNETPASLVVAEDVSGFAGDFDRLVISTGAPDMSNDTIQVAPLEDAPADWYLRISFKGPQAMDRVGYYAQTFIEDNQIDLTTILGEDMANALREAEGRPRT